MVTSTPSPPEATSPAQRVRRTEMANLEGIPPHESVSWTIANILGCHVPLDTAEDANLANEYWEFIDNKDYAWRKNFLSVVGDVIRRDFVEAGSPGGDEALHDLLGVAQFEVWTFTDTGERFPGVKAVALAYRVAGEAGCRAKCAAPPGRSGQRLASGLGTRLRSRLACG